MTHVFCCFVLFLIEYFLQIRKKKPCAMWTQPVHFQVGSRPNVAYGVGAQAGVSSAPHSESFWLQGVRQEDEVEIIVAYGQMGCKGSSGATGHCWLPHPFQLYPCICKTQLLPRTRSGQLSCQMASAKWRGLLNWQWHDYDTKSQHAACWVEIATKSEKKKKDGRLVKGRQKTEVRGIVANGEQRWKLKVGSGGWTETMVSNLGTVGQWETLPCNNQALIPVGGVVPWPVPVCVCLGPTHQGVSHSTWTHVWWKRLWSRPPVCSWRCAQCTVSENSRAG